MPLQNFIDNQLPTIKAAWLNAVDVFVNGGAAAADQQQSWHRFTPGGTVDAITGTLSPAITSYGSAGLRVTFQPTGSNITTLPTVALNGLAALAVYKGGALGALTPLVPGDLNASQQVTLTYNGTVWVLMTMPLAANVTTTQIKFGASADTTKNFILEVPAVPDGTLSIKRESGTAVATINAAGLVTFPGNVQTWQDVTALRAIGTPYQNLTGQPIKCSVFGTCSQDYSFIVTIDGYSMNGSVAYANAKGVYIYFEVPAGATYSLAAPGGSIIQWGELRI